MTARSNTTLMTGVEEFPEYTALKELPIDVLAIVFEEYAKTETDKSPIETLILVCKTWRDLCLRLRTIWSNFRIIIGTGPEATRWTSRVKRRLVRSGETSPMTIYIRNHRHKAHSLSGSSRSSGFWTCPAYPWQDGGGCSCYNTIQSSIISILKSLAGRNGQYCERWISLDIHLHEAAYARELFHSLRHPTPNLKKVVLGHASTSTSADIPILPIVPLLRDLSVISCYLPQIHKTGALFASAAPRLERLVLQNCMSAFANVYPCAFPEVTELALRARSGISKIVNATIPKLSSLTLELSPENLELLLTARSIPFKQVKHLGLYFNEGDTLYGFNGVMRAHEYASALKLLLERLEAVQFIRGDTPSMLLALKIMRDAEDRALPLMVNSNLQICIEDIEGRDDIREVEEARDSWASVDLGLRRQVEIDAIAMQRGWGEFSAMLSIVWLGIFP